MAGEKAMSYLQLRAQREGGQVLRNHTCPHIGTYSVAEHSHQMLVLLYGLHPNPSAYLAQAITYHDLAERYVGDLPAPVRLSDPDVGEAVKRLEQEVSRRMGLEVPLTGEEVVWLNALDKVEHYLWCQDQLSMGNSFVKGQIRKLEEIFADLASRGRIPEPVLRFLETATHERRSDFAPEETT
jgi:5'-deoxynucleotidase YfbR-like HD superfamily hydrolase